MPAQIDNSQNAKIAELIGHEHDKRQLKIPEKMQGDSELIETVNGIIERLKRQNELVVPSEIVTMSDEEIGRDTFAEPPEGSFRSEPVIQQPIPEIIEYPLFDSDFWTDKAVKVGRIISNDGSGEYTIVEQMWNPDLSAWVDAAYTVSGDGGATSPNGEYRAAGTEGGKTYFARVDGVFELWWVISYTSWEIGADHDNQVVHRWFRTDPDPVGSYTRAGNKTGSPVVAITSLSARDIEENPNGVAGTYVLFWQQLDTAGSTEAIVIIAGGTAASPTVMLPSGFETEAAQSDTWDRTSPAGGTDGVSMREMTRMAYDDAGDEILYAYYRTKVYDNDGALLTISDETRVAVETPETC